MSHLEWHQWPRAAVLMKNFTRGRVLAGRKLPWGRWNWPLWWRCRCQVYVMSTHDNFFNLLFSTPLIQFFLKQPACIYHVISFFKKVYVHAVSTLLFIIHTTICLLSLQAIDTLRSLMTPYQTQWLFELTPFSSFLFKTPSTLGWGTSLGVLLPSLTSFSYFTGSFPLSATDM